MTVEEARSLFAYNSWSNAMFFTAAEALSPAKLDSPAASSFASLRGTLAHIASAEWIWLQRWLGESPGSPPSWLSEPGLPELRNRLHAVEADRERFLAALSEGDLERVVSYRTLNGQPWSNRLCDLMRHAVNHSTYHRGQAATQLRQLGETPPNTDLIRYLRK
jgi:uncharacterized damage-inducible protein DinB